jgi:hypothetical protein
MVEFRRPDGGQLLHPIVLVGIIAYHVVVAGRSPTALEAAFFLSMLALVTVGVFVDGALESVAYPLLVGGIVAGFYLLQLLRGPGLGATVGLVAGLLFAGCGVYLTKEKSDGDARRSAST